MKKQAIFCDLCGVLAVDGGEMSEISNGDSNHKVELCDKCFNRVFGHLSPKKWYRYDPNFKNVTNINNV